MTTFLGGSYSRTMWQQGFREHGGRPRSGLVGRLPVRRFALSLARNPDTADDPGPDHPSRRRSLAGRASTRRTLDAWLFRILRNAWIFDGGTELGRTGDRRGRRPRGGDGGPGRRLTEARLMLDAAAGRWVHRWNSARC